MNPMNNQQPAVRPSDDFITIPDLWHICLTRWRWFAVSLAVCLGLAAYYLAVTPPIYTREASVLVKQESQGKNAGKTADTDNLQDLGLVMQKTNVANVQRELASLDVLTDVARRVMKARTDREALEQAKDIKAHLKAEVEDDKSTIVNLKYTSTSPQEAEQVLYAIVQVYNEKWLQNKNQMTASTSQFIEARLRLLENDLGQVDDSISRFKMRHKITDLEHVSDLYLQQQSQSESEILQLTNQRSMVKYLLDILRSKSAHHQLLPTNSGIGNQTAETQIVHYNSLLLQLRANMVGTSAQNPLIAQQEADLDEIRQNILSSLESQVKTLDIQLQALQDYNSEANSKISSNPSQAKHLVSVEREQKVKESLYLYLLQKKEENEISMTYNSVNTRLLDFPNGSDLPTSPVRSLVLMVAVVMALVLPTIVLFVRECFDNTVRDRFDIERKTMLSLVGNVPLYDGEDDRSWWQRLKRRPAAAASPFVVGTGQRNFVNEAFRLIRTNMEFMTARQGENNVYIVTSSYAGSGKTFVSMNLALTLAIGGRRVLLIDGDLRHASASHLLHCPDVGFADYLGERETDIDALLFHSDAHPGLDILPVGTIPPNPTELLAGPQLERLFAQLRPRYDFILVDCPPAETLADVGIIERQADRTLFVMRAGLFERKRLADLENDVKNEKFKHLSLILNATKEGGRYGYHYGYRYGYKYGYHHHYGEKE